MICTRVESVKGPSQILSRIHMPQQHSIKHALPATEPQAPAFSKTETLDNSLVCSLT